MEVSAGAADEERVTGSHHLVHEPKRRAAIALREWAHLSLSFSMLDHVCSLGEGGKQSAVESLKACLDIGYREIS